MPSFLALCLKMSARLLLSADASLLSSTLGGAPTLEAFGGVQPGAGTLGFKGGGLHEGSVESTPPGGGNEGPAAQGSSLGGSLEDRADAPPVVGVAEGGTLEERPASTGSVRRRWKSLGNIWHIMTLSFEAICPMSVLHWSCHLSGWYFL